MSDRTADERLVLDGAAEFEFDKDMDLEIDISPGNGSDRWNGVYLSTEQARELRDYLNRMLP
jgi:hypothetical protein